MPETKSEIIESVAPADPVEEPAAAVQPTPAVENSAPRVTVNFDVWSRLSGKRFDQLAGFRNHVKRTGLGPLTVLGWRDAFQKFMATPTN
jgi:hypothetical protein